MPISHWTVLLICLTLLLPEAKAQTLSVRSSTDSASLYLEQGLLRKARACAARAIKKKSSRDVAMGYALLGNIREEEGYLLLSLDAYRKSKTMARRNNNPEVLAKAFNGIASIQITTGQYDSVMYYLDQSRKLDTTVQNSISNDQAEGKYWQTQNHYDQALVILQRALEKATVRGDKKNMAIILSSMGSIYFSHNPDMTVALDYYQRSNANCDSLKHAAVMARNYGRMANAYMVMNNLPMAETYLLRARKITEFTESLQLKAYILSSWTILLAEQGNIAAAAKFAEEPMQIKRELGQFRQLQNDLLNTSELHMMIKQYDIAKKMLTEGTAISHSLHDVVYLKYFYNRQAMLDSLMGNYKAAYANLKRSRAYEDSTFSIEHLRAVNEVKEKYEAEQKEKIIAEKELKIEQQKYELAMIISASVTAVLILMVILIVIRNRSRNKLQQEKALQHHLRLQTIVQTQEDVQQRIARDLHDGLVQVLGAAKMSLQSVGPDCDSASVQRHIRTASDILDEAVTEARSISHQVLPYSLLKGGLIAALEELFERSLDDYEFTKPDGETNLSEAKAINMYRIVQELVNNVQKHAPGTTVVITLAVTEKQIRLTFQDNGRGFDASASSAGAGLSNMLTRAELVGGSITFHSQPSTGTHVDLIIPR